MSDVNKHITISKNVNTENDLDFSFLRKKGLEYIEQLSGNLWTDYNAHDPGITILEMLSYAISDLGLRINLPIENLLAPENNSANNIDKQFFIASEILSSKPVNELDYRKLFIDIKDVKNCWLKPYEKTVYVDCKEDKIAYDASILETNSNQFNLQGLYSVLVDFEENLSDNRIKKIKKEIHKKYHANRNLCEDLIEIKKVDEHSIAVCAKIEVLPEFDEEEIHAKVLDAIDNYFSPSLAFYSLKQMQDAGYATNEIFEGPLLTNGFLDPKELKASALRTEVRLSDIMKLIMEIKGVKKIMEISINNCNSPDDETDKWLICVEPGKKPKRCKDSAYSYYKGVLPLNINKTKVEEYREKFKKEAIQKQENAKIGMEIQFPSGKFLNTNDTTTIQNDFPDAYGINRAGLPSRASSERKAQAKQLKGYLLFFDQILATYFAHLLKVKDILSVDNQLKTTYFTQAVNDIKDFDELVNKYPKQNPEKLTKLLLSKLDEPIERKNKFLDHLIARFAEKFTDYAFLMKELYGDYANEAILHSKENFLKDYQITSKQRGSAFNYSNQDKIDLWNTDNVAGVQKRIARLAGMKNFKRRNLSDSFVEIYDLLDSDNKKVYRWRIKNAENKIILSATENYSSPGRAKKELNLAMVKIIETAPETIEKEFLKKVKDEDEIGNFEIQISDSGKYSFDVIDLDAPGYSTKRIIARQFLYYLSQDELKDAILEIIKFMTSYFTEEGMFIVEHILLRPNVNETDEELNFYMPVCTNNCESCEPVDPYSFRITVILPGWTYRFANPDFRDFMEELIRKEIPAHILARICWVGNPRNEVDDDENDLYNFEKTWKKYLFSKTKNGQAQNNKWLKELIERLSKLNSIYPSGRLIDCKDEEDSLEGKIILGNTYIGNL